MFKLNNKGFSLIELMIVVAIIGILASVAVPNFQKFMAKSKQGEAKSSLSALFTAQKTFFGEWNMYFGDFRDIGYAPEGDLRYRVGFTAAAADVLPSNYPIAAPTASSVGAGAAAAEFNTTLFCAGASPAAANCTEVLTYVRPLAGSALTATTFTASASGDLDGDPTNDVWTIDESKQVRNLTQDLQD